MRPALSRVIRPGDGVLWGQACAEPQTLVEALVAQRQALGPVSAFLGINYSGIVRPEHADHLRLSSYCGTGARLSGPVSTPRGEAGVIVTEHGAADLRGGSVRERARRLLAIAPPESRAALEREANLRTF